MGPVEEQRGINVCLQWNNIQWIIYTLNIYIVFSAY